MPTTIAPLLKLLLVVVLLVVLYFSRTIVLTSLVGIGSWFGLLGVFVAPPLLAVMICLYRNLYLPAIEGKSEAEPQAGG